MWHSWYHSGAAYPAMGAAELSQSEQNITTFEVESGLIVTVDTAQGCAKKLVPGCEKSSAQPQPDQSGHASLVLNKIVTFYAQRCSSFERLIWVSVAHIYLVTKKGGKQSQL